MRVRGYFRSFGLSSAAFEPFFFLAFSYIFFLQPLDSENWAPPPSTDPWPIIRVVCLLMDGRVAPNRNVSFFSSSSSSSGILKRLLLCPLMRALGAACSSGLSLDFSPWSGPSSSSWGPQAPVLFPPHPGRLPRIAPVRLAFRGPRALPVRPALPGPRTLPVPPPLRSSSQFVVDSRSTSFSRPSHVTFSLVVRSLYLA